MANTSQVPFGPSAQSNNNFGSASEDLLTCPRIDTATNPPLGRVERAVTQSFSFAISTGSPSDGIRRTEPSALPTHNRLLLPYMTDHNGWVPTATSLTASNDGHFIRCSFPEPVAMASVSPEGLKAKDMICPLAKSRLPIAFSSPMDQAKTVPASLPAANCLESAEKAIARVHFAKAFSKCLVSPPPVGVTARLP